MADIRVERRRRLPLWPWAVGLLVVAVAIWGLTKLLAHDEGDEVVEQLRRPAAAPAP